MIRKRIVSALKSLAVGCAAVVWMWVMGYILFLIGITFSATRHPDTATDAIVVLTGGQNRIYTGLNLLEEGKAKHLFISGVNPGVSIEQLVRLWKPGIDVMPCCIMLGYAASNTEGNARESSEWVRSMDLQSIRLVTSNYHLARSWLEFSHALPRREIIMHPVKPDKFEPDDRYMLKLSLNEYNKTILTWIRLYIYPWNHLMESDQ